MKMPKIFYALSAILITIIGILFIFVMNQTKKEETKIETVGDNNLEHLETLQDGAK